MLYRTIHTTSYLYSKPVTVSHHALHLKPRVHERQTYRKHTLEVSPRPTVSNERTDYFGNPVTVLTMQEPHQKLTVHVVNEVEITPPAPLAHGTPPWEEVRDVTHADHSLEGLERLQFCFDSPLIKTHPDFSGYALESFTPKRPLIDALTELTQRIHKDFKFDPKATTVSSPLHEVFKGRRGVCQDFAHLEIACLRALGLAARYVSGYVETAPPPDKERLIGADASHAWLAVFCPGCGWIDLDPTNNQVRPPNHITLAWGRDYSDISPIRGVILGGGDHSLKVAVDVIRLTEVSPNGGAETAR